MFGVIIFTTEGLEGIRDVPDKIVLDYFSSYDFSFIFLGRDGKLLVLIHFIHSNINKVANMRKGHTCEEYEVRTFNALINLKILCTFCSSSTDTLVIKI